MRIVSANVQHGVPDPRGRPDLLAVGPVLRALGADVVALQELDRWRCRTRLVHQGRQIAGALDGELVWARAKHWLLMAQGNALVVRGTVLAQELVTLPGPGERRVAALARVSLADGEWSVGCTHLSLHAPTAVEQLRSALQALDRLPPPWVLAGDLNLEPAAVAAVATDMGYQPLSGPATVDARSVPRRRLDHVLVRGGSFESGGVAKLPVSDHLAVWAELSRTSAVGSSW